MCWGGDTPVQDTGGGSHGVSFPGAGLPVGEDGGVIPLQEGVQQGADTVPEDVLLLCVLPEDIVEGEALVGPDTDLLAVGHADTLPTLGHHLFGDQWAHPHGHFDGASIVNCATSSRSSRT